mgnify:CR=1 FL=1
MILCDYTSRMLLGRLVEWSHKLSARANGPDGCMVHLVTEQSHHNHLATWPITAFTYCLQICRPVSCPAMSFSMTQSLSSYCVVNNVWIFFGILHLSSLDCHHTNLHYIWIQNNEINENPYFYRSANRGKQVNDYYLIIVIHLACIQFTIDIIVGAGVISVVRVVSLIT